MSWFRYLIVALMVDLGGFWLGRLEARAPASGSTPSITHRAVGTVLGVAARFLDAEPRVQILAVNPGIPAALQRGGYFGVVSSIHVARCRFSRDPDAIRDIRAGIEIIEMAPRSWQTGCPRYRG